LPPLTAAFERFKQAQREGASLDTLEVPEVPFQMLTALNLPVREWAILLWLGSWQVLCQNFKTLAYHRRAFAKPELAGLIAEKLRDPQAIVDARGMPWQLFLMGSGTSVSPVVRNALEDAIELALLANVPDIPGRVVICPDVSGSMSAPVTGFRKGASSTVRCIDVAALIAAAILRKNRQVRVLPFERDVVNVQLNPRDSVMTNAQKLASIGGGGTACSAPLALLNQERAQVEMVILISDYESWVDANDYRATQVMREWETLKQRNPSARLACINITPYRTTQAAERDDILNVGGFSDAVFQLLAQFADGTLGAEHWVGEIDAIALDVEKE